MEWIETRLRELADEDDAYRTFNARVVATADPATMLGVRVPRLRKLAREVERSGDVDAFLDELPHALFEEYLLHAFVLDDERDLDALLRRVDELVPHVDNWCVCDALAPRALRGAEEGLLVGLARRYLASDLEFGRRFGVSVLMRDLLPAHFSPEQLEWAAAADDGRYYVRMMVAWYVAEALVTQEDAALALLAGGGLSPATSRAAIQKGLESRRVPEGTKGRLRELRRQVARRS